MKQRQLRRPRRKNLVEVAGELAGNNNADHEAQRQSYAEGISPHHKLKCNMENKKQKGKRIESIAEGRKGLKGRRRLTWKNAASLGHPTVLSGMDI